MKRFEDVYEIVHFECFGGDHIIITFRNRENGNTFKRLFKEVKA